MKVAIASGKGGTGKTFVTVNLARSHMHPLVVLDCDVEEPNSNLFLTGELVARHRYSIMVPQVDASTCNGCGMCADVCEYNAIAVIAGKPLVFEDLCHACGGCAVFCPQEAMTEVPCEIGTITIRQAGTIRLVEGLLDVGKALAVPLIRAVQNCGKSTAGSIVLLDAPPGTTCPIVRTIGDCDVVVLLAEPTAFGLHDLHLAVDTVREVGIPFGVVINKDGLGDTRVDDFCREAAIPILGKIPHDRQIAQAYANGDIVVDSLPQYRQLFSSLWANIEHLVCWKGGLHA